MKKLSILLLSISSIACLNAAEESAAPPTAPQLVEKIKCTAGSVNSLSWNQDGIRIVTGGGLVGPPPQRQLTAQTILPYRESLVALYIINSVTGKHLKQIKGHQNTVRSVEWHPDGQRLVSGADDKIIRVIDSDNGRCSQQFNGSNAIWSLQCNKDGRRIASEEIGTVNIWDLEANKVLRRLKGSTACAIDWHPDNERIAVGSPNQSIFIWDTRTNDGIQTIDNACNPPNNPAAVRWNQDGVHLASSCSAGVVRLWDIRNNQCTQRFTTDRQVVPASAALSSMNLVRSLDWHPDGRRLAAGCDNKSAYVLDIFNNRCLQKFSDPGCIYATRWSPEGNRLAIGSSAGTVHIWEYQHKEDGVPSSGDGSSIGSADGERKSDQTDAHQNGSGKRLTLPPKLSSLAAGIVPRGGGPGNNDGERKDDGNDKGDDPNSSLHFLSIPLLQLSSQFDLPPTSLRYGLLGLLADNEWTWINRDGAFAPDDSQGKGDLTGKLTSDSSKDRKSRVIKGVAYSLIALAAAIKYFKSKPPEAPYDGEQILNQIEEKYGVDLRIYAGDWPPHIPERVLPTEQCLEVLKDFPEIIVHGDAFIIGRLCYHNPEVQKAVMQQLDLYQHPKCIELFKEFGEVYDNEISRLWLGLDEGFPQLAPLADQITTLSNEVSNRIHTLDDLDEYKRYCEGLLPIHSTMQTILSENAQLYPSQHFSVEITSAIQTLMKSIENFLRLEPKLGQTLGDRGKYGRYQPDLSKKEKKQWIAIIEEWGLPQPEEYLKHYGTTFHLNIKARTIELMQEINQKIRKSGSATLQFIAPEIKRLLRHAFTDCHLGEIAQPTKLLLIAETMNIMARSEDQGRRAYLPIEKLYTPNLRGQEHLLHAHSLYLTPTFHQMVQQIPTYRAYMESVIDHLDKTSTTCPACKPIRPGATPHHQAYCPTLKIAKQPERTGFYLLAQREKNRFAQEDAQQERIAKEVEQLVEAEMKGYQASFDRLIDSPLDIVQRRSYIQERESAWYQERQKKIDYLENGGQRNIAALTNEALTMIARTGGSADPFQTLVSSPEEQVLQNEFIELANESAKPWDHDPELQGPLPEMMLKFAEAGSRFVMVSDLKSAHLVANSGNAMREYFYAFSKGVAKGIMGAGKDLAAFIVHPIKSSVEFTNQCYNLSYQLGRVLQVVADIAFSYDLPYEDQLQAWERGDRNAQALYNDANAFYQVLKHHYDTTPGPKLLEEVTESLARSYARKLLVGATLDCVGKGVDKLSQCVDKIKDYTDPPGYTLLPDGTVVVGYTVGQVVTEATVEAQSMGKNIIWAVISGKDSPDTGRYRSVEELLKDSEPDQELRMRESPGDTQQYKLKGDAKKIFAELAISYGEKIVRRGTTLIFGKKPNVVSLHLSKTMYRPTISFDIGKIKYKIRIDP